MLSNYNTNLIKELYKDYNFNYVETKRNIGAKAKDRVVEEVIITNYKIDNNGGNMPEEQVLTMILRDGKVLE